MARSLDSSAAPVVVAPREIADAVYRACRVGGADSGIASMLGRSACFSVGQLASDLSNVVDALADDRVPNLGFAPIAQLECGLADTGEAHLALDSWPGSATIADLAYPAFGAVRRGSEITMVLSDGSPLSVVEWLRPGGGQLEVVELRAQAGWMDAGLGLLVEDRHRRVLGQGLEVTASAWAAITETANGYLVAESVIDSAEQQG